MSEFDRSMPRRAVLQGVGAGISTGLLSGFAGSAHAQPAPAERRNLEQGLLGEERRREA